MAAPLRVLILEDRSADAELMVSELRRAGFKPDWQRVDTEATYLAGLETAPDLILADHSLPRYGATQALKRLKESGRDIPFIIVTGSISEEVAVERMKQGAADYLLKDRLARLGEAVRHALVEKRLRDEKRQAEQALAFMGAIVASSDDAIIGSSLDGVILSWNAGAQGMYGYNAQEAVGRSLAILAPPGLEAEYKSILERVKGGEHVRHLETKRVRKDGRTIDISLSVSPIIDADERVTAASSIVRDITELKRAQADLAASEERYRSLVETSPDAIVLFDLKGTILFCNQRAAQMTGYPSAKALVGTSALELAIPEHRSVVMNAIAKGLRGEQPTTEVMMRVQGGQLPLELRNTTIKDAAGKPTAFLVVARDIRERKQAEEQLRKLSRAVEQSANSVVITDLDGAIEYVNPRFNVLTGYSPQEVIGKTPRVLKSGQTTLAEYQQLWNTITSGKDWRGELWNRKKDGSTYLVSAIISPIKDEQGHITHFVGIEEDITEKKRAEAALREGEERYHDLVENSQDLICTHDLDGNLLSVNEAAMRLTGYSHEALLKMNMADLLVPKARPLFRAYLDEIRTTGRSSGVMVVQMANGDIRTWEYANTLRMEGVAVPIVRGLAHDITERRQAEQALEQRASQLALLNTIGQQVASVMELDPLLATTATLTEQSFGYDHVGIFTVDRAQERLVLKAKAGSYSDRFPVGHSLKLGEGITGWVAQSGDRLLANDVSAEPRFHSPFDGKIVQAELSVPIKAGAEVLGVLDIQSRRTGVFTDNDVTVLETLAGQIAVAMQNAQLYERARGRATRLELISRIGQQTTSILDVEDLIHQAARLISEMLNYHSVGVLLIEGDELVLRGASHPLVQPFEGSLRLKIGAGSVTGRVASTGQPIVVPNVDDEPGYVRPSDTGNRSELAVPIHLHAEMIGVLNVEDKRLNAFSEEDVFTLQTVADQLAPAIKNARLYKELEEYGQFLEQAVRDRTADIENIKERLESILDNCPDPIILLDRYGAVESANSAFFQLFRTDADAIHRRSLPDLVAPEHQEMLRDALHQVMVWRRTQRLEVTARCADETTFEADMALALIRRGSRMMGAVCILRDISALKEVERLKDQFVSNVSHELRTPITSLKLTHDLITRDPAKQAVYLERMGREISRLNLLIEDLLLLSRLEQGRLELRLAPVDLNEMARRFAADRGVLAESKGLMLSEQGTPDLPLIQTDDGLLGQAVSVFLTNAINYTPSGGRITLHAQMRKQSGQGWAGISVSDTGPGIPPDEQPQLFKRFVRGSVGRNSGAPGTGLGLAISKQIVDRLGGTIELHSNGLPGEGTTFTIWLPIEGHAPNMEAASHTHSKRKKS